MKRFLSVVLAVSALALLLPSPATAGISTKIPAESFQPIRVESGVTAAFGFGNPAAYGFGAVVEPKFNLMDNLSLGLRTEAAVLFSGKYDDGSGTTSVSVGMRLNAAAYLKAEWFFTTNKVRPFAGFAFGAMTSAGLGGGTSGASIDAGRTFAIAPSLGINLGGLRLAATYHVVFGKALVTIGVGNTQEVSRNYLAIELTGTFGGKRTKARTPKVIVPPPAIEAPPVAEEPPPAVEAAPEGAPAEATAAPAPLF